MKKTKKLAIFAAAVVIVCLACFFVGKSIGNSDGIEKMSAIVLENRLTEINELASVTYSYTNMAEFENSKDFYGMKVPFTTKSFILTYDGEIKAGVDLSDAEVSVKGKTVTITLPEAKILSHEMDEDSIEVFDESTSIFNPFKVEDYQSFCKDQKVEMEKKAKEKGLLTEARKKAAKSIQGIFAQVLDDDYTLKVK